MDYRQYAEQYALNYPEYRASIDNFLSQNSDNFTEQEKQYLPYYKMNVIRMNRLDKTVVLQDDLLSALAGLSSNYTALVITEGWCGDAAQNVPVMNAMAKASAGKINLRCIPRDKYPELIAQYLTNGSKAIPKLLFINNDWQVAATWGPRPAVLQDLYLNHWKQDKNLTIEKAVELLQGWYAKDKTLHIQQELAGIIRSLK
ncbi:thioredoxin family protein [Pedobacter sp. BS3]|uniref:thioredoxin family protein n=1 Tax=Pedobacter sp. BS3 TaxID=2567937 RepID=UPI0011F02C01|nr:thioredoxin family protein [Pedobacter sp. BS3]TZF84816.1 thioredoxin family protein [Pedobacter sp. BS3]